MYTENKIIEYALSFPDSYLDYPFHNDIATIRHKNNGKIFVFIIPRDKQIWINLKCDPMNADFWRSTYESVIKGYHMNDKSSWNTVIMDDSVPWSVLEEMIGDSYELIMSTIKKPRKNAENK